MRSASARSSPSPPARQLVCRSSLAYISAAATHMGRLACEARAAKGASSAKGVAVLRDDINNALKTAMKAQDPRRVSTLLLVNSAIKNADIEARGGGKGP